MKKNNLLLVLLIFLTIISFFVGRLFFSINLSILAVLSLRELLLIRKSTKVFPIEIELMAYILVVVLVYNNYGNDFNYNLIDYRLLSLLILANLIPLVFIKNRKKYSINDALYLISSTLFIGITFNLILLLRNYNADYVVYIFLISIFTDLFSYISGRLIGRHILSEKISDNKTVEGLVFGTLIGTFIPTLYFLSRINISLTTITVILVTLILSILAQLGDLVFCFIKREYTSSKENLFEMKNYGILNKLDSMIFILLGFILILTIL